jgi:hypothetical protein
MRVTIGLAGVLGFGMSVTVALAQGPGPARGARLLPPQPLEPADTPIARGAPESLPGGADSTPATRPGYAPGGPAWINGTATPEGGVRTAAGTTGGNSFVRPLTPKDDLSGARGMDKLKSPMSQPPGNARVASADPRNTSTASTPFQGTAANGQRVYAGPPAYRWYGWGSVTPGANPIAPSGHYPIASANWYAITGATPGAFPVPVMNPARNQGTEPPVYVATPPGGRTVSAYPTPQGSEPHRGTTHNAPGRVESGTLPPATVIPKETPVSHVPQPETPKPVAVPTIAMPPAPLAPIAPPPTHGTASAKEPEDGAPRGPAAPPATNPVAVPLPALPTGPSPLPVSVTDDPRWGPANNRPGSNEWAPTGGPTPVPQPVQPQSRAKEPGREPTARGQVGETQPDPVAALIRKLCDGRGNGVDVRWTGTKKLTVCFECRSDADAQRLVKEISARPELTSYQIDFCVLVK